MAGKGKEQVVLRNPPIYYDQEDLAAIKKLIEERLRMATEDYSKTALGSNKEARQATALKRMIHWQDLLNKTETIQSQTLE